MAVILQADFQAPMAFDTSHILCDLGIAILDKYLFFTRALDITPQYVIGRKVQSNNRPYFWHIIFLCK